MVNLLHRKPLFEKSGVKYWVLVLDENVGRVSRIVYYRLYIPIVGWSISGRGLLFTQNNTFNNRTTAPHRFIYFKWNSDNHLKPLHLHLTIAMPRFLIDVIFVYRTRDSHIRHFMLMTVEIKICSAHSATSWKHVALFTKHLRQKFDQKTLQSPENSENIDNLFAMFHGWNCL